MYTESAVKELMKGAVVEALSSLGIASGEISYNRALKIYGQDFVRLVRSGRLTPCRVGEGKTATRYYLVSDIAVQKAIEYNKAEIFCKEI